MRLWGAEKRSEAGWARFNAQQQLDNLEKGITPTLERYARDRRHFTLVREHRGARLAHDDRQRRGREATAHEERPTGRLVAGAAARGGFGLRFRNVGNHRFGRQQQGRD